MSQQLVVGKYKFYPYEREEHRTISLNELVKLRDKIKSKKSRAKTTASPRRKDKRKD